MRTRTDTRRPGAAAAELAFVLPVLLLIALGALDFGRFAYLSVAVANSARAGAEYAITTPYTSTGGTAWATQVQLTARDELTGQTNYTPANLTTATTVTVEGSGLRRVQVTATYTSFTTVVPWPWLPASTPLHSTVVMRVIR